MKCAVVVEGAADEALLSPVLDEEIEAGHVRIRTGGGRSAAVASARTILGVHRVPVVLLLDADTTDDDAIAAQRVDYRDSLLRGASESEFRLIFAEPCLEEVIFHDQSVPHDLFGVTPTDVERARAEYDPKRVLRELSRRGNGVDPREIPQRLTPDHIRKIREAPLIREIRDAIDELTQVPA